MAAIRLFYSPFDPCLGIVLDRVALAKLIRHLEGSAAAPAAALEMIGFSLNEIFLRLLLAEVVCY